jgi:hypothetical protein
MRTNFATVTTDFTRNRHEKESVSFTSAMDSTHVPVVIAGAMFITTETAYFGASPADGFATVRGTTGVFAPRGSNVGRFASSKAVAAMTADA